MSKTVLAISILAAIVLSGCGGGGQAAASLTAEFSASPRGGYAPSVVQFSDKSTGEINAWQWDFDGDGTVDSTQRNPRHSFGEPGNYTVSLTVSGRGGADGAAVQCGFCRRQAHRG
jgi:PKD repeat protein